MDEKLQQTKSLSLVKKEKETKFNNIDLSALDKLSPAEKELAFSILNEYSKSGKSDTFNELRYEGYKEIPVDIITFVDDYRYLGNAWHDSEGKSKLYPYWRKELVKLFPDNITTDVNNVILSGSRGRGKAQPLDSLVFTEKGYVKMGDIQVGDNVYGDDGKLHKVLGVFPQGKKKIYEITFSDHSKVKCSDEHLWFVRDNNDMKWKTLELKDIINSSLIRKSATVNELRYKIPLTQSLFFNQNKTLISPYLMGCLIGDGCFSNCILLTTKDDYLYEYMSDEVSANGCCLTRDHISYIIKRKNKKNIENPYVSEIKRLGLYKKKSNEKFIPKDYLYNDVESRISLLQGLMDTDGTVSTDGSCLTYSTTSFNLAEDIIFLVQSLGGAAYIRPRKNRTYKYKDEIRKCLDSFTIALKLPKNINPFRLSRKIDKLNKNRLDPQRNIKSIDYIGYEDCQCIYIDSDSHLYLTDNLIVTHNTEIAMLIAAYLLHRVLCLENPVSYYHLKATEKLVFAFMNIKLALAEEIGVAKFQNTIQSSPWFLERGTLEGRTKKVWVPNKINDQEVIDIKIGSRSDDLIGLPIFFCLDGDTEILTNNGVFKIKDLENKKIVVPSISNNFEIELSNECSIKKTGSYKTEYEIELEDGSIIKCTPNHRFMLSDGNYKEAKNLTLDDDLMNIDPHSYICKIAYIKNIKINNLNSPKDYYDVINAYPYNNFLIKTKSGFICSHNCFFDEISFIKNKDVEEQKKKANDMIDTAIGGMKTRFIYKGKNPTVLALASSKRSDKSFLEEHMKKKLESEKDNVYISDGPVWEVKPKGTYKDETFKIAVGNKFLQSTIVPDEADPKDYIAKGYKLISAPIDFKSDFIDDIDRALCDFAGISSSSITKYINGAAVHDIITDRIKNPFTRDILEIGNGPDDDAQYYNFFDINRIDPKLRNKPLFIHLDMSISGDMTGISGVFISGKKLSVNELDQSKDLFYSLAFSVDIKAPKGRQISFEKNRNFIYWLKSKGFNIKGISSDSFQSYDLSQILIAKGYPYTMISVDRCDTNHVCVPYQYFKSTIYEKRLEIYDDPIFIAEATDLERNNTTGKIDHPSGGKKDRCDSICGAIFNASKHAEEYAYDYGESSEQILRINSDYSSNDDQKQLVVDFEEELKKMSGIMSKIPSSNSDISDKNKNTNFNNYDDIIIL